MSSAGTFTTDGHTNALPPGTRLNEFEVRRVIGVGGFGIVYLCFDHGLEREVAIKEYMPSSLASRTATLHVSLSSPNNEETFKLGLRSFVNEAKMLARFDHRSLIKVHRFWEERGTAYMVMPLLRGRTLREARRGMGVPPTEAWLRGVLDPVLGALEVLHREDVFHRDIAPDNILIGDDGVPMLLDFGAARHVIQGRSQTLTAILKPSYAPIEQYGEAANLRQGAWTDLYALGATFHFLITESPPLPATVRTLSDDAAPLATMPRPGVSDDFLRTVDWMLAPRPADRPQSVAELREVLSGRLPVPVRTVVPASPTAWQRTEAQITVKPDPDPDADIDLGEASVPPPASAVTRPPQPAARPAPPMPRPAVVRASHPPASVPPNGQDDDGEGWSATGDRVLPPRPSGLPARSLAPMFVGGGAVLLIVGLLIWYLQRPPAEGPRPAQAAPAASVAASAAPAPAASAVETAASLPAATAPVALSAASSPVPAPAPAVVKAPAPTPAAPAPATARVPAAPSGPATQTPAPGTAPMTVESAALRPLPASAAAPASAAPRSTPNNRTAAAVNERRPPVLPGPAADSSPPRAPAETAARSPASPPAERSNDGALTAVPAAGRDPREQCGGRMLLALHKCLVRECVKPQFYDHGECVQVRAIEERARVRNSP
ncbi:serine/threonine protein kinase [Aquabacterium sp.]|uniref:serine/threonine protein kinase n=1 Tax=Aquabacterium sp. TaxID=1872578 RepID=UPI002CC37E1E|nr:protein kinase [Aquabacterium sp.]HSW09039.1 protein kinase [Aquabacterium sp.]